MQKHLESTHIACQQKGPVAVPVVLLFTVSTDVISYILSAGPLQDFLFVFFSLKAKQKDFDGQYGPQ